MIITLIAHERNLGIMTLTDYLLEKLGRDNCAVVGCNYLVADIAPVLESIKTHSDIIDALHHHDSDGIEEATKTDLSIAADNLISML